MNGEPWRWRGSSHIRGHSGTNRSVRIRAVYFGKGGRPSLMAHNRNVRAWKASRIIPVPLGRGYHLMY